MKRLTITAAVFAGVLVMASAASASSIANGSFETGTLDGWTVEHADASSLIFVAGHAHSGVDAAWFGAIGAGDDSLSQTFATVAGASYVITFWLAHGATDSANDFKVWWDTTPLLSLINAPAFGPQEYVFRTMALGDQATLRFSGREVLDFYYMDDVAVAPVPTPEPTTLVLLVSGVFVIGAAGLTRRGEGDSGPQCNADHSPDSCAVEYVSI